MTLNVLFYYLINKWTNVIFVMGSNWLILTKEMFKDGKVIVFKWTFDKMYIFIILDRSKSLCLIDNKQTSKQN